MRARRSDRTPFDAPLPRLPELKRTPVRGRHPLVYGAALSLGFAVIAFAARLPAGWGLSAIAVAILMAGAGIAAILRRR